VGFGVFVAGGGNLQSFVYPNGVTHTYTYDPLNRLTQMGASKSAAPISSYGGWPIQFGVPHSIAFCAIEWGYDAADASRTLKKPRWGSA
jgi:hypothetical protein